MNFKNSVIAMAIGVVMISCGGRGGNQQGGGQKTDVEAAMELLKNADDKGVTDDNWQAFIKKNYSVDAAVPAGWKYFQVRAYGFSTDNESIIVAFETSGDGATKVADAARALFDQTKALVGNFSIDVDNNSTEMKKGETYASFSDANRDIKSAIDQFNNIQNDPNKTDEQKIQDALRMLEGLK